MPGRTRPRPSRSVRTGGTTRHQAEVQDTEAGSFAQKLQAVFRECHRVLKDEGLLVFTYHHSRGDGWKAVAEAVLGAGFRVLNSQPVRSKMSVGTPKSAAREPIQFDIILVCREARGGQRPATVKKALESARMKIRRLTTAGFDLPRNDRKIVLYGQLLATAASPDDSEDIARRVEGELASLEMEDGPLYR
jgi:putative DNA methylase